jgi:mannonate dehydratase
MAAFSRRALLGALGLGGAGVLGLRFGLPPLLSARPVRALGELSEPARALVAAAFAGLRAERVVDLHVHVAGLGGGGSGCWVNPRLRSHRWPLERLRFELYLSGSGVEEDEHADRRYVERLTALLAAGVPGVRLLLLAFDVRVDEHGREDLERSTFRVPDEHVCALARAHPGFLACASVHPYRADALARLERARALGAVAVKWLPNAMGIDPAAARCAPYYAKLVELGLPLLVHTGEERAVWAADDQELGNPLRLRAPLAAGVTVVALHCASLGSARDLDRGDGRARPALELFLRLLAEHGPGGRLFGELSAVTQVNRDPGVLRALLARSELHARLLNGSDYPLVAIDPLTHLGRLAGRGLLAFAERAALRELFEANPLLFDLVLKRRLRLALETGERRFAPEVFESARLFDKL